MSAQDMDVSELSVRVMVQSCLFEKTLKNTLGEINT